MKFKLQAGGKASPKPPKQDGEDGDDDEDEDFTPKPSENKTAATEGKLRQKNGTETGKGQDIPWLIQTTAETPERGVSYLVRRGIYLDGVCHCSDLVRSSADINSLTNQLFVFIPIFTYIMQSV